MTLSREIVKRIRRLEISTRRIVAATLAGQYHSVFKGRGMAFSEVRQYEPGDDVRTIDWNVTARMHDTYVKVFHEERELTVMLLVDVSGSLDFGTKSRSKAETAAEIAAMLAFSAIANNDRVGLILFSDVIEKRVPARKGKNHVLRIISEILRAETQGRKTSIETALNAVTQMTKRKAVVFVISDFVSTPFDHALQIVSRKHDVIPISLYDPAELHLPDWGLIALEDAETKERVLVDSGSKRVREAYEANLATQRQQTQKLLQKLRLDTMTIECGTEYQTALRRFFTQRARRIKA